MGILVFLQHGGPWVKVAVFEAVCGLLIVGGLLWDGRRGSGRR